LKKVSNGLGIATDDGSNEIDDLVEAIMRESGRFLSPGKSNNLESVNGKEKKGGILRDGSKFKEIREAFTKLESEFLIKEYTR